MSIESRILSYSSNIRKVAFCHVITTLASLSAHDATVLSTKYERYLNALAPLDLIDDEIEEYLPLNVATQIIQGYIDSTGFIKPTEIHACYMAMSMAMEYRMLGSWAAMDILWVKADYPHKIDINGANCMQTIFSQDVKITYGLNPANKRGAYLINLINDIIKKLA